MSITAQPTVTAQPTSPTNGAIGNASMNTDAEKLAGYTWKPFVPPLPYPGWVDADGDTVASQGVRTHIVLLGKGTF